MTTSQQDRALIGHLLRRSGFGASGAQIDAASALGYPALVESLFAPGADPGAESTAPPASLADPALAEPRLDAKATPQQRKAANAARTQAGYDLVAWWLSRMVAAHRPWTEKRTFFWHGHFATSVLKVRSAALMLKQNQTQRALGGGDFRALMRAMFTDPAMMLWLDAAGSTAKAPNENLARESMELFSLGVGNYTESDVRQAALALTGWRLDRASGEAVFAPKAHAAGAQSILGRTAGFDVDSFTDLLMAQPANARFIASRLWFRLGSADPIPAETLSRLVAAYGPDRDLTALARAVFTDPVFTAPAATAPSSASARYALVKQPAEYVVGALRALKINPPADGAAKESALLRAALGGLGQVPFAPPNVGGWPSGRLWLTTAATQARVTFAHWVASVGDVSEVADAAPSARADAVAHLLGIDAFSARTRSALADLAAGPADLVELALLSPEYAVN
ncbi:DUF1800 domain-containing protein [Actinocrinis puniceicyclus]|uniref:DUF1800 domain-containing protein n=1 Tax=Actinocrinis puniceicyclus TaxID=977794 RepID=A0A8J7WMZ1_9ACTN|nr:DUF1800 domain-containing protein [Actinocrinis puniceicyclus]MBS2965351.1 DUF1800 domain-containing protein [Actinocrinis puniceicyclus]